MPNLDLDIEYFIFYRKKLSKFHQCFHCMYYHSLPKSSLKFKKLVLRVVTSFLEYSITRHFELTFRISKHERYMNRVPKNMV